MPIPRKIGVEECVHCRFPCKEQVYRITHRYLDGRQSKDLVFCCWRCMMDYFEVVEKIQDRVDRQVQKEKRELHKRVCPACVRRFAELA